MDKNENNIMPDCYQAQARDGGVITTSPPGVLISLLWWTCADPGKRLDESPDDSFPRPPITTRRCRQDRASFAIMQNAVKQEVSLKGTVHVNLTLLAVMGKSIFLNCLSHLELNMTSKASVMSS